MADPEVGLPQATSQALDDPEKDRSFQQVDDPKLPSRSSSELSSRQKESPVVESTAGKEPGSLDHQWPIHHRYLDFETVLPPMSTRLFSKGDSNESMALPDSPDLSKFQDPFTWPRRRKDMIIWLACVSTTFTAFTAGSYSPGAYQMADDWGVSHLAVLVGVTTFTSGFAFAPMVLAPFSEINGRRPVFIVSGILFVVCQLCCAVTRSYAGMLVARFFTGVGGSVFSTMVGGVVSDMYDTKDRNTPMTLFSAAALFGTGLGPVIGGLIAYHANWRWLFWQQVIVDAVLMIFVGFFFKETRGSVLLSNKAEVLNKYYAACEEMGFIGVFEPLEWQRSDQIHPRTPKDSNLTLQGMDDREGEPNKPPIQRVRWKVKADNDRASLAKMITVSLTRPFVLLFTEPVVFSFSLWVSFSWAVLYMTLAAIPLIYSTNYGFNIEQQGAVFTSICVASLIFTVVCLWQERWGRNPSSFISRHFISQEKWASPESRLVFSCAESALLPVGLFIFGWTAQAGFDGAMNPPSATNSIPWIAPTIGLVLAIMGIFSIYLAVFNYMADIYGPYASSALAAQSFCRNIIGGAFPLVTNQLFTHLGYGAAGSLLGGLGVALTFVPFVLCRWGPLIRRKSRFAISEVG